MKKFGKYEKLAINFLEGRKNKGDFGTVFYTMNKIDKWITNWDTEEVDKYLIALHATTANTLFKRLSDLRLVYRFACKQENKEIKKLAPSKSIAEFIDMERASEKTITKEQYDDIKNHLVIEDSGGVYNYRDKVIFELAWHTLTNEEIRNLKEKDIEFINGNAVINIRDEKGNLVRSICVTNEEFVQDLINCMNESEYLVIGSKTIRIYPYRESEYLIKPVKNGREPIYCDGRISNPGIILWRKFDRIEMPDDFTMDVSELNIECIRRSRMIHELTKGGAAKDKSEYLPLEIIQDMFGKAHYSDISWLKGVAEKISK